jgi:hypothetical protein
MIPITLRSTAQEQTKSTPLRIRNSPFLLTCLSATQVSVSEMRIAVGTHTARAPDDPEAPCFAVFEDVHCVVRPELLTIVSVAVPAVDRLMLTAGRIELKRRIRQMGPVTDAPGYQKNLDTAQKPHYCKSKNPHVSAVLLRRPCLALHRRALPVQLPPTTGIPSAPVCVMT